MPSHGTKLLRLGDNLPTGIQEMEDERVKPKSQTSNPNSIYNLQGQRLSDTHSSPFKGICNPRKGIYIQNGRKVIR